MKHFLKFLPILIIPALLVQTSCTSADIEPFPERPAEPACKLSGDIVAEGEASSTISLDVIFRDFQAERTSLRDSNNANTYPGFQEFDYSKTTANKQCGTGATKGMVQETLDYSQCNSLVGDVNDPIYIRGRYCARPMPSNGANTPCYGANLQMWYTDGPHTKTIQDTITLKRIGNTGNTYQIKCDKNTPCNGANGYFPLDKYGREANDSTWGFQGQTHNFGYTLAGSAEFKYDASKADVINFLGDDDMWIFIDGKLAVDLGGVHTSISENLNIQTYGDSLKWKDGTMHVINFFYAERQTTESNLSLVIPISSLPPQFGSPRITKSETFVIDDSRTIIETVLYVSHQIDMNIIKDYLDDPSYGFPIVVWTNVPNGPVYGYKLESMTYVANTANGYAYLVTGTVCKEPSCNETRNLVSGDSLSFNVKYGDFEDLQSIIYQGFALGANDDDKYIRNAYGNARATTLSWAVNVTTHPPMGTPIIRDIIEEPCP
jgi:fibro-slime domain-containing protein